MGTVRVVTGMPDVSLSKEVFAERFKAHFNDPAFDTAQGDIDRLIEIAWKSYSDSNKSPRTRKAGPGFADPGYDLSLDWLKAREGIIGAEERYADSGAVPRILIINGSTRSDLTCPGEMSKTFRLATIARETVEKEGGLAVDFLDLSRLASEYGRVIYPCKACVSTAMPLCHWPCSCYPNHALGQVNDWMNDIYPLWVAARGIMILCPVNWYQAPSSLKLMIDRLVCADGGNPDPTSTHGKDPQAAKEIELEGWHYPRHLKGRLFSIIVHGDSAGAENLRRMLSDWLTDMGLIAAGSKALLDRYVGYYNPYATSHDDLDNDRDFQDEVRNAARTLAAAVRLQREGRLPEPDAEIGEVRPK